MSMRYKGAILSATPPTTNTALAPGEWTLSQQMQSASSWPIPGPFYIEDVFQTWLYTGNGSTQTITNGIDLSTKGGLVWLKQRSTAGAHGLYDTARGATQLLVSSNTNPQSTFAAGLTSFNANGFSLGNGINTNTSAETYASWTFRKAPKFFDVVTYTGTGANRTIAHALGSTPGCIIIKNTSAAGSTWAVYHRSYGATGYGVLNNTDAFSAGADYFNNTAPTSTVFSVGSNFNTNNTGDTYVAYLFAHNAGGFGLTGTDNVISCESYTGTGVAGNAITLGYEPQLVIIKRTDSTGDWLMIDSMRGFTTDIDARLWPNLTSAETNNLDIVTPTATGFITGGSLNVNVSGGTYIYIAIRRGPMKTPTSGTSVFVPAAYTGTGGAVTIGSSLSAPDFILNNRGRAFSDSGWTASRLTGDSNYLVPSSTAAEVTTDGYFWSRGQAGVQPTALSRTSSGDAFIAYLMCRAPGFFDVVCYTGNGPGTQAVSHNLGAVPELVINKGRSVSGVNGGWTVFQGSTTSLTGYLCLNTNSAQGGDTLTVSSTSFTANSTIGFGMNTSGATYVTYLFASCPGVSKVGRYTGTGATQTVDCGFTGGARFVLIKRFDTTGDWYVWDTARGMVSGTDPSLLLNSTAAEVNANSVYTTSVGFQVVSTAAGINASGGTYIYLAIA